MSHSKLRPFTDQDWQAFAGCECLSPFIAELPGHVVIRDGRVVQLIDDTTQSVFHKEFETFELAVLASETIAGYEKPEVMARLIGLEVL